MTIKSTAPSVAPTECFRAVMDESEQGSITAGSYHDVLFDLLPVNTKGGTPLNTSTGIFTVPSGMAGIWDIQAQIRLFALDPGRQYTFTIEEKDADPFNGVIAILDADAEQHSITAAWRVELSAGDEIVATLRPAGSGYDDTKIDGNAAYSWMDFTFHPRAGWLGLI